MAINAAHTKHGTTSIGLAQRGRNAAYSLGSAFNCTNVFKEADVLITCKGKPILIGIRDSHGRYRIPLMQQRGQWQPQCPSKQARIALRQANSVYDLPSTEQAIKWMHAVCGYPVKSTWLKAIKAGKKFRGCKICKTAICLRCFTIPKVIIFDFSCLH